MKKNMANLDRIIRTLLVAGVVILYATGVISGTLAVILAIMSVIFLVTSFTGLCPLYSLLGISTRRQKDKPAPTHPQM